MQQRPVHIRRPLTCVLVGVALSLSPLTRAAADDGEGGPQWNPRFTHFTPTQYALTLTALGAFAASSTLPTSSEVHWRSEILFDHGARGLFAASTEHGRKMASDVSDYLALGLALYPFAVDALLTAGAIHGNADVAIQMALIGMQSLMVAELVTNMTKRFVGRARPDFASCQLGNEMGCASQNESFISGHTSTAFVGAGLICATQQNLRLYGSEVAGAVACGTALGVATTVGTLRMVADRHHMSDVLAGAAVGLAAGYLLPNLTNYDFGQSGRSHGMLTPIASGDTLGLQYLSLF